jgi:SRSO17 transposase
METTELAVDVFDPDRWGLPADAVASLAERLQAVWTRFRPCFTTTTRDPSFHAWTYLRGVLTMTGKRTFANIARRIVDPADDGQALQQFMSDSPWSARAVIAQVQAELAATPALHRGGMLILDESADAKAGLHSAGAARQWNGRLGKVDLCQVGVFLAFATETLWTWLDGELFLPEQWFAPEVAAERTRLGIPQGRPFATKVELGWQMIERILAAGVPFEVLLCDDL